MNDTMSAFKYVRLSQGFNDRNPEVRKLSRDASQEPCLAWRHLSQSTRLSKLMFHNW